MVLSLRDPLVYPDPIKAALDKFRENFTAFMKTWTPQVIQALKQTYPKFESETRHNVLICGYAQEDDCLCVVVESDSKLYQQCDAITDFEEAEVNPCTRGGDQTGGEDDDNADPVVPEVGDLNDFQTAIGDINPQIHQVFNKLDHPKVNSLPIYDFSSPKLVSNTVERVFVATKKVICVAGKVFDESSERDGYIPTLNPKPPDEDLGTQISKLVQITAVANFETTKNKKITFAFGFPGELDTKHMLSKHFSAKLLYDLSVVLIHKGSVVNSGHYVVHIKGENTHQWWEFDDEYQNFLAELGGTVPESLTKQSSPLAIMGSNNFGSKPPWVGSNIARSIGSTLHLGLGSNIAKIGTEIDGTNWYIGYLPLTIKDDELIILFQPFGDIVMAKVIKDRVTRLSKGCGFVKYFDVVQVNQATTSMNGHRQEGRVITVRFEEKPFQPVVAHVPPAPPVVVYPGPSHEFGGYSSQHMQSWGPLSICWCSYYLFKFLRFVFDPG